MITLTQVARVRGRSWVGATRSTTWKMISRLEVWLIVAPKRSKRRRATRRLDSRSADSHRLDRVRLGHPVHLSAEVALSARMPGSRQTAVAAQVSSKQSSSSRSSLQAQVFSTIRGSSRRIGPKSPHHMAKVWMRANRRQEILRWRLSSSIPRRSLFNPLRS